VSSNFHIPVPEVDPRLLAKAAKPGRVRGIALDAYRRALAQPVAAGGILRRAMRDARALHSRERRFVADTVFHLVRYARPLDRATGVPSPLARWLGWLVHLGLPPEAATETWREDADHDETPTWGPLPSSDDVAHAASVPDAIGSALVRAFGERALDFVQASNARAPLVLRVDPTKGSRDALIAALRTRGIDATPGVLAPHAVRVPQGTDVRSLPERRKGWLEIQDEASQLVVELLEVQPGDHVWDVCAGAGGKTLAIATQRGPHGRLVATDIRGRALGELQRRAKRAGLRGIRTLLNGEHGPPPELGGPFDRVLVDAPCAGTGVWRRHPELRWRLAQLPDLLALQAKILDQAAPYVKRGGRLVYATCSVLPDECEDQVRAFLQRHPAFERVPARQALPEALHAALAGPHLRTTPHEHDTDGFFGAVFQRMG
jgi:16S rRNA (cytosine967-C5)-methyltransferase